MDSQQLFESIRPGSSVTIGEDERTGKAVMKGPAGWVLNMGGTHGTPAIDLLSDAERYWLDIYTVETDGGVTLNSLSDGQSVRVEHYDITIALEGEQLAGGNES